MDKSLQYVEYQSPLGCLLVQVSKTAVVNLGYPELEKSQKNLGLKIETHQLDDDFVYPMLNKTLLQLDQYFKGERQQFDLELDLIGTPFQKQVWQALIDIPFGETASYQDIANAIGNPKAVRAVGGANNRNPVSIVVPCHRVIGKNGSLVGYGGGLDRKQWLLALEAGVKT